MYDGLGGTSKPDIFPEPVRRLAKKPVKRRSPAVSKVDQQKRTIDKFFGSFDSP